jgi:hypothetical protein
MKKIMIIVMMLAAWPALAQTSTSFKVEEHVFNAGGHPSDGDVMASTGFRITLDAIGESVGGSGLNSASFRMDGGFGVAYSPPGEIQGLGFTDHETLTWNREKSAGVYNLYRDQISNLSGLGSGSCEQNDLPGETATDFSVPAQNTGYFYLVTVENRIGEEGTKGSDSADNVRPNLSACP